MSGDTENPSRPLTVTVFDVGHGDSILIEFPDGEHVGIVDCRACVGTNRAAFREASDASEPKVLTYLRQRAKAHHRTTVAFLCISHYHFDHFEGSMTLVAGLAEAGIQIQEFWDTGLSKGKASAMAALSEVVPTKEVELRELQGLFRLLRTLRRVGLRYRALVEPRAGMCRVAGVRVDAIGPDADHWNGYNRYLDARRSSRRGGEGGGGNEHLVCSGLMLTYGKARMILGGDLTCAGWRRVVANHHGRPLRSHAVKASHHGSRQGNFLSLGGLTPQSLWPRLSYRGYTKALISGGYRSGLPHVETVHELRRLGVDAYCTGDWTARVEADDSLFLSMPRDAAQQLRVDSYPVVDRPSSYHGDIRVKMCREGMIEVTPEFVLPVL